ncbi:MAG: methyltransferase domain-containing protein [Lachnospiraceae bacterium]|nr:methyltransferase domain-containing protein [Lachnospiraceae bacterium]
MSKISLRIADLRKKNKVTQQELADSIGVSFQTVSKWETGINMPDITVLPLLAEYFSVSTDQLLGLKPLDGEAYIPEKTATKDFWNQKLEYLLRTRKGSWNDDYAGFLVSQVWKIDKPVSVLDCGCGYGFLGLLFLPCLPEGSAYTGIDFAEDLINKGKAIFEHQRIDATFLCKNVFEYSAENQYDFVICQAVLRHLDNPAAFIQKMITFAKPGGYVVCIDSNREFECCGLYIDGMDYQALCRHEGLEKKWQTELTMQGRDYAVAIRTAHMMQKLGLVDVDVRMSDKAEFITTQSANYEETKSDFITYNDWTSGISEEEKDKLILHLLTHGLSRKEAEDYCNRNIEIANFFLDNPIAGYTFVKGKMISYGKKPET